MTDAAVAAVAIAGPRALDVYSHGRLVGHLESYNDLWRFAYAPEWREWSGAFDLSPHIRREQLQVADGATLRPVQWFFDNLLPEDRVRTAIAASARIAQADAFALLEYLGAESAGALTLVPGAGAVPPTMGWQPLPDVELSRRIQNLPNTPIATTGPKRMSLAGAQHKLLVGWDGVALSEPLGNTPSTHILKPAHLSPDYPHSVINEYAMMCLARRVGLEVPPVWRHCCPQPVYIVERFDRGPAPSDPATMERSHVIDVCQLLNAAPTFKYQQATLDSLAKAVSFSRNRISTRQGLFRWLLFNVLIGNHDNHLKNISLLVSPEGARLAPTYDLLSTAVYHTPLYPLHTTSPWPEVELAIPLPGQSRFSAVTRQGMVAAGVALGLSASMCEREITSMADRIVADMDGVMAGIILQNQSLPPASNVVHGGELQLVRAIRFVVIAEMVRRLSP
ncbi:MAG: hypothetical protein A3F78_04090 [Burkholderiales bacterium RIFCSPLOWO2_12_FULL_61_40]|nr:MAG: hypothetical protein A3F78_04090 [Burkholderiales bacterium RIFCSPLOWO2_12_FULL_61_40]